MLSLRGVFLICNVHFQSLQFFRKMAETILISLYTSFHPTISGCSLKGRVWWLPLILSHNIWCMVHPSRTRSSVANHVTLIPRRMSSALPNSPKYDRSKFNNELDFWVAYVAGPDGLDSDQILNLQNDCHNFPLRGQIQSPFLTSIFKCFTEMICHGLWRGIVDTPSWAWWSRRRTRIHWGTNIAGDSRNNRPIRAGDLKSIASIDVYNFNFEKFKRWASAVDWMNIADLGVTMFVPWRR